MVLLAYVVAFVVMIVFSVRVARPLDSDAEWLDSVDDGLLRQVHDLEVSGGAISAVPVANIAVAGVFAHRANRLRNQTRQARDAALGLETETETESA